VGRAHVVLEPGEPFDEASLEKWARNRLAGFKLPREIVIETELPRTASGKVRKHRLRDRS
jgi:acyl-CoA synthetase (AMP-forming)/AMP-acid ligase II